MTDNIEIKYSEIFRYSSEGLIVCNERGEIEAVNPRMLQMFGYENESEVIGHPIEILIPDNVGRHHVKKREGFTKSPSVRSMGKGMNLRGKRKHGSIFPVEISLSHYKAAGKTKVIAFVSDITTRKEVEDELMELNSKLENEVDKRTKELRNQNALLLSISRNFPDGNIYVLDKEFNIILADGQLLRNNGFDEKSLVGLHYTSRLPEKVRTDITEGLHTVFNGGTFQIEVNTQSKYYSLLSVPLNQHSDNSFETILVVELDITNTKKAELDMIKALNKEKELNQLKSNFVSLVSHEFRTPLSTIQSSAQLIEKYEEKDKQDRRLKHTGKIQNSVATLNHMIEDILSLSKLEEGLIQPKFKQVNLPEIIEDVIADVSIIYPHINVKTSLDDVSISSDDRILKRILTNLIENSCKYSKENGSILIECKLNNENVSIVIKDDGIGIPEEDQKNLFNRFYRATNAQNIKGTGLGLHIVQKYINLLNGDISFESNLNAGTTFFLNFPK